VSRALKRNASATATLSTSAAERVDDVTAHPAFRPRVQTIAARLDFKVDPAQRELIGVELPGRFGERESRYTIS